MEWTNDLCLKFVNLYEKFPILWDPKDKFYKITPKKNEAWVVISEELDIGVPELKKKMTSLFATYRKVRQKLATPGKSGSGADDVDSSPVWFAFKTFGFLHTKYKPKSTINTEVGLEVPEIQNEESRSSNEENLHVGNSQEESNVAQTEEDMTTPSNEKKKDEFDAYGEYIANVLRSMDKSTYAYVNKEFGEIIFKAESGTYASRLMTQAYYTFSSPDYSRPSSRDSENSHQASYMPVQSTSGPSVANPQQNTSQSHSFNQNSQSHYLQLDTQEVLPLNKNASSQLTNLQDDNSGFKWN
ncbi:hypothetical protein MML48_2g00020420 [Holotrichia oblita]|uniref:Uncharacterized protein n=1 Tax=Holotrichia oblita TaxID=644536 RepID=A0ACB9TK33_HOLOL|nr:hypothetical protein MML48_2g00020420 [Holotrichia oblita]